MSKAGENSPYRRGDYWLGSTADSGGSNGTDYWAVFWYDADKRRTRSTSTRTADLEAAKDFLDSFYVAREKGQAVCPTCGQVRQAAAGYLVTDAIDKYLRLHAVTVDTYDAIVSRLAHVLEYISKLPNAAVTCEQVDKTWIELFRKWSAKQPIISTAGKIVRERSLSTTENSVIQLAAAINFAYRNHDTLGPAKFRPIPTTQINRTPHHRSDVEELASMFRFCAEAPDAKSEKWRLRKIASRRALHRYLVASVVTLGRPDAVFDMSFDPKRKQWNSRHRVFNLNPHGRRQTKKYRAVVKIAPQIAPIFDSAPLDYFVGMKSVRTVWRSMVKELGLPEEGESGMKLIRRSMAHIMRQRLPEEAWGEVSMFMGHDKFDNVSDIYAPFDPTYLRRAGAVVEAIIDEIKALVPDAFSNLHGDCTGMEDSEDAEVEEKMLAA